MQFPRRLRMTMLQPIMVILALAALPWLLAAPAGGSRD